MKSIKLIFAVLCFMIFNSNLKAQDYSFVSNSPVLEAPENYSDADVEVKPSIKKYNAEKVLRIALPDSQDQNFYYKILDQDNQEVKKGSTHNVNFLECDLEDVPEGNYFLLIENSSMLISKKIKVNDVIRP